jgi:D-glucuronyl C5-epimerase C-terminus
MPRRRRVPLAVGACLAAAGLSAAPASARESSVLVLGRHGRVAVHHLAAGAAAGPAARPAAARRPPRGPTVVAELKRLLAAGQLTPDDYALKRADYDAARRTVKRLKGTRRAELGGVVADLEAMAAAHRLNPSRLPALWETLDRNREWWTTGPLLGWGQRVGFSGSELVWQYYPRHGVQIQWLGTFGKLNALWQSRSNTRAGELMEESLALAAQRAGGIGWEYLFDFDGSRAPWVSSLAQGTGLQALARTAVRLERTDLIPVIAQGLDIFETPPPEGVRVETDGGAHYLEYSGLPSLQILNGFIQSLVGLYDYAALTGDPTAQSLLASGLAAARVEVPRFDTGAWSLYSRGSVAEESDLHYHVLLRDFLNSLCRRTADPVFCGAAARFTDYLSVPPVLQLLPARLRAGRVGRLSFRLSKISRVAVQVWRGTRVLQAAALGTLGRGTKRVAWRAPRKRGIYQLQVTATDLAGNSASAAGPLAVSRRR